MSVYTCWSLSKWVEGCHGDSDIHKRIKQLFIARSWSRKSNSTLLFLLNVLILFPSTFCRDRFRLDKGLYFFVCQFRWKFWLKCGFFLVFNQGTMKLALFHLFDQQKGTFLTYWAFAASSQLFRKDLIKLLTLLTKSLLLYHWDASRKLGIQYNRLSCSLFFRLLHSLRIFLSNLEARAEINITTHSTFGDEAFNRHLTVCQTCSI